MNTRQTMRKEADGAKLNHLNIFSLDRLNTNNFEVVKHNGCN